MTEPVQLERRGRISWVTFNRPEQRNALTLPMYEQLVGHCRSVNADPEARVLVLAGRGGSFVAGMDIAEFRELADSPDPLAHSRTMDAVFDAVENVRVATIAAIDGAAVGAGAAIAACCDLRVGSHRARFGFSIARTLGNALSPRNIARLVSLVGVARTKDLLFTGRLLEAGEMQAVGLLNTVFAEAGSFEEHVQEYAESIAGNAPLTLRATKSVVRSLQDLITPDEALDAVVAAYSSRDFSEGVNAFFEKRKPQWKGE